MTLPLWILDSDHAPIACGNDIDLWYLWMQSHERRVVARDFIGDALVSTVFIGIHTVRFETMVFADEKPYDGLSTRSHSWQQAEKDHAAMCAVIRVYQERREKGGGA